jgi:hypothetical protein
MNAEPTGAADSTGEQHATKAGDAAEEQPTQAADAAAEGETQYIHAWALADDADTEVTPFLQRSWKIPAAVSAVALAIATAVGVGVWSMSQHYGNPAPVPSHQAAVQPSLVRRLSNRRWYQHPHRRWPRRRP